MTYATHLNDYDRATAQLDTLTQDPDYIALQEAIATLKATHQDAIRALCDSQPIHAEYETAKAAQETAKTALKTLALNDYHATADKHPHDRITIRITYDYQPSSIPALIRALATQPDDKLINTLIKSLQLDSKTAKHASEMLNLPITATPNPSPTIYKK